MSIRRGPKPSDHYAMIANAFLRDPRLTLKARGLGGWLLTHAEGFGSTAASIAKANECGVEQIQSGLNELEKYGYLNRQQQRDDRGRVTGVDYVLTDQPGSSVHGKPDTCPDQAGQGVSAGQDSNGLSRERAAPPLKKTKGLEDQEEVEEQTPSADADAPPRDPQPPLINPPVAPVQAGVQPEHRQDEEDHTAAEDRIAGNGHLPLLEDSAAGRSCSPAAARKQLAEETWPDFWTAYDYKRAKQAARRAWDGAIIRREADPGSLLNAARRYRATFNGDRTYMKHPASWLNAGCWEDELPMRPGEGLSQDRVQAWLQGHQESGNAEAAAREAGVAWCGWQVYLTPEERLTPESRREALVRWGRAWIGERETELVTAMTRRTG